MVASKGNQVVMMIRIYIYNVYEKGLIVTLYKGHNDYENISMQIHSSDSSTEITWI